MRNEFYKDTQGALLVFDCTSRRSFDALDAWHREATGFGAQNVSFALCGNKVPPCAHDFVFGVFFTGLRDFFLCTYACGGLLVSFVARFRRCSDELAPFVRARAAVSPPSYGHTL